MTYGLSAAGFLKKRLDVIKTELEDAWKLKFGDDCKLSGDSVSGEIIGIMAERMAELWELDEAVYLSQFPDHADGVPLDNAVALTGHSRQNARFSTDTITCTTDGDSPITLPAGRQVRVTATGATFATLADAIIPAGGSVDVACRAIVTGPLEAPVGTLTEIVTPVSGWDTATNAVAAVVGRNVETGTALRLRRQRELSIAQGGTIAAMEARIPEQVTGVTFIAVQENRTSVVDGEGRPPHSVHVVVIGGLDADVALSIWQTKPVGANTFGSESAVIVDSAGNNQTIYWDRATDVPIYLIVNLTVTGDYPTDGDDSATAILAAFDDGLSNGDDVLNWRLAASLDGIDGITGLVVKQGIAPTPTLSVNTAIAATERASISAANIIINHV